MTKKNGRSMIYIIVSNNPKGFLEPTPQLMAAFENKKREMSGTVLKSASGRVEQAGAEDRDGEAYRMDFG